MLGAVPADPEFSGGLFLRSDFCRASCSEELDVWFQPPVLVWGWGVGMARERTIQTRLNPSSLLLFQGSAPILVAMVILLNIGVAILFINFFI